jgi:transcription-repair coupling factor (superfamily II helicase)
VADQTIESLAIEYAGDEVLRLPVYRLDAIERWVPDQDEAEPPASTRSAARPGSPDQAADQEAIERMATELLELYAARELAERPPYPEDTRWQKEMESSFLYEDTPDQRAASRRSRRTCRGRGPWTGSSSATWATARRR